MCRKPLRLGGLALKGSEILEEDPSGSKWTNVSASSDMKTFQNLQSFTLCTQGPVSLARVEELCAEAEEGHSVPGEGSLRAIAVEQMKA